ncbi:hypothetical protein CJ030_MR3G001280 [Morella rubra]|uniref:Glycolipid transfer protein domain-containing protein n=1 Tax=Morella rubra TaxID=262757 RepID=A0A6A1W562_9ROSI|nr:hypothetical protein CJ030_MR3G001280 [Morella rubra]
MANLVHGKPLRNISEVFKELVATVDSQTTDVEVASFSRACSLLSPLIDSLGIAFKFAEMDYADKVPVHLAQSRSTLLGSREIANPRAVLN